jgi:hypothetical protein
MLNREKSKIIYGLVLLVTLISCRDEYDRKVNFFREKFAISEEDMLIKQIRITATDTFKSWINKDLKYFHKFKEGSTNNADWKIDEWVFINSKRNKCLISILVRTFYNATQDDVYFLLGERYDGKWWFYPGPDLVVVQQNYNNDLSLKVLPFNTLSEIARRYTLNWYYTEKQTGVCINELFASGYSSYKKCSDEQYLINDEYFEKGFNWEVDRQSHSEFLKEKYDKND